MLKSFYEGHEIEYDINGRCRPHVRASAATLNYQSEPKKEVAI